MASSAGPMSERILTSGLQRTVLAIGAVAYVAGILVASAHPGPRAWALHLPGFLPAIPRTVIVALLAAGAILLVLEAMRPRPAPSGDTWNDPTPPTRRTNRVRAGRARLVPLLLLPLAMILWLLRARTQLLGDGTVWLSGLQAGVVTAGSEPLSAFLWLGLASILRSLNLPITAETVAILPIACGLVAAVFAWAIARELTPQKYGTTTALAFLLTLGITQLYCGYIESYPPAAMFVLGYLWVGMRRVRGAGPAFLLPLSFALCIASHFVTAALTPSFVLLALREPGSRLRRFALAAAGPALAVLSLLLMGSHPADWLRSLGTAARGVDTAGLRTTVIAPAYGVLSGAHLVDFVDALLLVLPIPLLLLVSQLAEWRGRVTPVGPDMTFLAFAAIPGSALAALLRLPLPPAQDWDLTAIMLLPTAVFAIRAARSVFAVPGAKRLKTGLVLLSAGGLLSFLLVNANEAAAIRRFETILAPGARITTLARAYGNDVLWKFHSERGDFGVAHRHSLRALEAEPNNPRYWTNAGLDLYRLGRFDEALPYLEGGVRRGLHHWDAMYDLGLCYNAKGRYAEAAEQLGLAVRYGGDRPEVLHSFGIALYRSGRPDSAIAIWCQVIARWPTYVIVLPHDAALPH